MEEDEAFQRKNSLSQGWGQEHWHTVGHTNRSLWLGGEHRASPDFTSAWGILVINHQ